MDFDAAEWVVAVRGEYRELIDRGEIFAGLSCCCVGVGSVLQRWLAMCERLGIAGEKRDCEAVLRGWRSFGRRYHSISHLEACLAEFDGVATLAAQPAEVECALWFHDAIYRTWRSDNEARSAQWAARVLRVRGAAVGVVDRVNGAILATRHAGGEKAG